VATEPQDLAWHVLGGAREDFSLNSASLITSKAWLYFFYDSPGRQEALAGMFCCST